MASADVWDGVPAEIVETILENVSVDDADRFFRAVGFTCGGFWKRRLARDLSNYDAKKIRCSQAAGRDLVLDIFGKEEATYDDYRTVRLFGLRYLSMLKDRKALQIFSRSSAGFQRYVFAEMPLFQPPDDDAAKRLDAGRRRKNVCWVDPPTLIYKLGFRKKWNWHFSMFLTRPDHDLFEFEQWKTRHSGVGSFLCNDRDATRRIVAHNPYAIFFWHERNLSAYVEQDLPSLCFDGVALPRDVEVRLHRHWTLLTEQQKKDIFRALVEDHDDKLSSYLDNRSSYVGWSKKTRLVPKRVFEDDVVQRIVEIGPELLDRVLQKREPVAKRQKFVRVLKALYGTKILKEFATSSDKELLEHFFPELLARTVAAALRTFSSESADSMHAVDSIELFCTNPLFDTLDFDAINDRLVGSGLPTLSELVFRIDRMLLSRSRRDGFWNKVTKRHVDLMKGLLRSVEATGIESCAEVCDEKLKKEKRDSTAIELSRTNLARPKTKSR